MSDQYLGEIRMFAGNFAPVGWALCQGQLMSIAQNSALFSILGTTYGGDGISNFALPNLSGRAAVGAGTGPGLAAVVLGEQAGANQVTLLKSNLPAALGTIPAQNIPVAIPAVEGDANAPAPSNTNVLAIPHDSTGSGAAADIYSNATANSNLKPFDITVPAVNIPGGTSVPVSVQNPYLGMTFIIALQGIYPSRG